MNRMRMLWDKSIMTLKQDGIIILIKKIKNYIEKCKYVERSNKVNKQFSDVLFINGCFLPHPSRYRVTHQREQMLAGGLSSEEIFYEDLSEELVKHYRMFIFFRCPITDTVDKFIRKAKEHNKVVIFDVDDLVIDTKYTDNVNYLNRLSKKEKFNYDSGVNKMKKTLCMCDSAITTTEALAEELQKYVPEVYINRNTASNEMVKLSENVIKQKKSKLEQFDEKIKIGYFSGSITHNDDFLMILPVIIRLMNENKNIELHIVGELDIPEELKSLKENVIISKFIDWKKLPEKIAGVDINIVPLEDTLFNNAKSENKWIEASLVKVVTVASNVGAFKKMISNGETGVLCDDSEDWYWALTELINNKNLRNQIAYKAYEFVYNNCTTIYTAYNFTNYIKNKMIPNIAFVLPSLQISGGVLVILRHCLILKKLGIDILIINEGFENKNIAFENEELLCISRKEIEFNGKIDKCVGSLWSTLDFVREYFNIEKKYYLVQGFETDFNENGSELKVRANSTYCIDCNLIYLTISKWCESWLKNKYGKECRFAPNGLNLNQFTYNERDFNKQRIRILIEGNCNDYYKNVDESFKIVEKLDKNRFEIWYMSYEGKPKPNYHVDKFFYKVPYSEVQNIYKQCDILIKSSILESFSYPPLEMLATGGFVVVAQNDGNKEYLVHEKNSMIYESGDVAFAVKCIDRIVNEEKLRNKLLIEGIKTVENRSWNLIEDDILRLYT